MRIAILGATSQIAKDLLISFSLAEEHEFALFARQPQVVANWIIANQLSSKFLAFSYEAFNTDNHFDAIINFIGSGNPALTASMGADIFDITLQYDLMALDYIKHHQDCRYLFLSSGAAYGSIFDEPANRDTKSLVAINSLKSQDWYGVAKLYAECIHRAHADLHIVDIRVFNYFSHTQDIESRFLITDILRAIRDHSILETSSDFIVRDFLHPSDFYQLVSAILSAPPTNDVVDAYSLLPVNKIELLKAMQNNFGLIYHVSVSDTVINATGGKPYYFSLNKRAENFGYQPTLTSLDGLLIEAHKMLKE